MQISSWCDGNQLAHGHPQNTGSSRLRRQFLEGIALTRCAQGRAPLSPRAGAFDRGI